MLRRWTHNLLLATTTLFVAGSCFATAAYEPRGVGGGGAMSGYSISPYSRLRFVGTDMGTLFRSGDGGAAWAPVSHYQATFDSNLDNAAYIGFSADPNVVFHAPAGLNPKRSQDAGVTWTPMPMPLKPLERIKYWTPDSTDPSFILAATTQGLLRTTDKGASWKRVENLAGQSKGTWIQYGNARTTIYHATALAIYVSVDRARSFQQWYAPEGTTIRAFTGGADAHGVTMSFIDTDGTRACAWARGAADSDEPAKTATMNDCGFVWVSRADGLTPSKQFARTTKEGGDYARMAENDSRTIYVTGGHWVRQYGTKVWVSYDAGASWQLKFHLYDWDTEPYQPWDQDHLEYSAVGLDVGWDDSDYTSFSVNARDSSEAGGTGYYFLHTTRDAGQHWLAPFTKFADEGPRGQGKRWQSVGLEMTSVMKLKFNPTNPKLGYATVSDMAGFVTEDGGLTWRVSKAKYNTNYDYAFDPAKPDLVYAASGAEHDFPLNGWKNVIQDSGGIFESEDRGRTWTRLTPEARELGFNRQFLSVAYDPVHGALYGGTQGAGVCRSIDGGATWSYINDGIPEATGRIIPQIEIDPANGNVYALLTADGPNDTNQKYTGIYFLDVAGGRPAWELLRGTVHHAPDMPGSYKLWWFPSSFAVDFTRPERDVLWLTDMESHGEWLGTGAWKSVDRGQTWDRMTQDTHPTSIVIDPMNPEVVYVGGGWHADHSWGEGGAMYTTDGGRTWQRNDDLPLVENLYGMRPDPNNSANIFYLFFGGGMLYGPKPAL